MTAHIAHITDAALLPEPWDSFGSSYFQSREFLLHAQKFNPCRQRYYTYSESEKLQACAVVYTLRLDILTYLKIKSPLKMHIIGIPCSVSASGIFGESLACNKLKEYIFKHEKGFVLCLNMPQKPEGSKRAVGTTLPSIIINNSFGSWDDYIKCMRHPYRRRMRAILSKSGNLNLEKLPCQRFNKEMYQLYLEVYKRSKGKLEKLSFDFFCQLPGIFKLTACYHDNKLIGWNITVNHKKTHYFFLGGIDYSYNRKFSTYFLLLSEIVKDAINQKAEIIELGQTAETPKIRLGGKPVPLFMEAKHSNRFFNFLLHKSAPLLSYKLCPETPQIFREECL